MTARFAARIASLAFLMMVVVPAVGRLSAATSAAPSEGAPTIPAYALGLREVTCNQAGNIDAAFSIPAMAEPDIIQHFGVGIAPDDIWIDLTLDAGADGNGDFRSGRFIGFGPLPSLTEYRRYTWTGLTPNRAHYYRLHARYGDAWRYSGGGVFDTPDCTSILAQRCSDDDLNDVNVAFRVPSPGILEGASPIETWLDLSLQDNGFAPGTFLGAGPFAARSPAGQPGAVFTWVGLRPANPHYWRVNTNFERFGWVSQRSGRFRAIDCNSLFRVA